MNSEEFKSFPKDYWEMLANELILSNPVFSKDVQYPTDSITLSRNADYKIVGSFEGIQDFVTRDKIIVAFNAHIPGKWTPYLMIGGRDENGNTYSISGCHINTISDGLANIVQDESGNLTLPYHAEFSAHKVLIKTKESSKKHKLIEWYLDGTNDCVALNRKSSYYFTKERIILDRNSSSIRNPEYQHLSALHTLDHVMVKVEDFSFIIHKVPECFTPQWSDNLGIEYSIESGRIPSKDEREAVRELVGFLLGKELISIGHTAFNESGDVVESEAITPWQDNVRITCLKDGYPPIKILHDHNVMGRFGQILEQLLPRYIQLRKELKLDQVLLRYWIGKNLPLGTNIPIMASGLEILADNWLDSSYSTDKGTIMNERQYQQLISGMLSTLSFELQGIEGSSAILNKIKDANKRGSNKKMITFLNKEIKIIPGLLEDEACKYRNIMIHSTIDSSKADYKKIVKLTHAYWLFFHRVFLASIGYDGPVIDYTTEGWPEKPIRL